MSKGYKISKEVKEQILNRIKNDGISVTEAAKDHGLSYRTIYGWLSRGAVGQPTWNELNKLKKERNELLRIVGELTINLSNAQKKTG
jgi:transposase-like protein